MLSLQDNNILEIRRLNKMPKEELMIITIPHTNNIQKQIILKLFQKNQ